MMVADVIIKNEQNLDKCIININLPLLLLFKKKLCFLGISVKNYERINYKIMTKIKKQEIMKENMKFNR